MEPMTALVLALALGALGAAGVLLHRQRRRPMPPERPDTPPALELREVFNRLRGDRLFKAVMGSIVDAVIVSDEWGRILAMSASAERLFGYDEREILGLPVTSLMPVRYRERHSLAIERAWRTGVYPLMGKTIDVHGLHKTGAEFPIANTLQRELENGTTYLIAYIRLREETPSGSAP
jgi:PAS domain S-box-containing protein